MGEVRTVAATFDAAAVTIPEAPADPLDTLLAAFRAEAVAIIAAKQRRVNELESEVARLKALVPEE